MIRYSLPVSACASLLCATSAFAQLGPIETFVEAPFQGGRSPVTDGVIGEDEYDSSYFYSFVDLENPGNPFPPLNQMCGAVGVDCNDEINVPGDADLSADVFYAHDEESLFIGFKVIDLFLNADEDQAPFHNDGVELVIDADADGADGRAWSLEGFKLNTHTLPTADFPPTANAIVFDPDNSGEMGTFFVANSVQESVGYTIEFQIPLASLDVEDGDGYTPASTGSLMRTNFAINDIDVEGGDQGTATHAMQWVVEDNPLSPFGGAEEVWVVGLALTESHVPDPWPGDVDGDGHTDVSDLNVMALNWQGSGKTKEQGDLTGDGSVNAADLNILALNWQTWRDGMPAAVPEPASLALVLSAFLLLLIRRRR